MLTGPCCPGEGEDAVKIPLIVIVDDDVPFLELMDDLLREVGCRAVCCTTTQDALTVAVCACPDLIILDLWMESRDAGLRLLEQLRGDYRTAMVPVLICSADYASLTAHANRLRGSGCGTLAKPFKIDDLFAHVSTLLSASPVRGSSPHISPIRIEANANANGS